MVLLVLESIRELLHMISGTVLVGVMLMFGDMQAWSRQDSAP